MSQSEKSCLRCCHAEKINGIEDLYRCRKNAPSPRLVFEHESSAHANSAEAAIYWPIVSPLDWCSEFSVIPRPNAGYAVNENG